MGSDGSRAHKFADLLPKIIVDNSNDNVYNYQMSIIHHYACKCDLCQHVWLLVGDLPTHCSKCKSRQWNTPSLNAAYRLSLQGFRETFSLQMIGKLGDACGLYAIVRGDDLLYVGRSINIVARCRNHKSANPDILPTDVVWWLPLTPDLLEQAEIDMIAQLAPRLNKQIGGKSSKKIK